MTISPAPCRHRVNASLLTLWLLLSPAGFVDAAPQPAAAATRAHAADLQPNGALIAADDLQLQINGSLANSGTLKGSNSLLLAARDIGNHNGSLQSEGSLELDAVNDLTNQSGRIAGRRVAIVAGRDIKSERLTDALQLASVATTRLYNEAGITAGESLNLTAGRDLALIAANTRSGTDTRLQAGRNLDIGTIAAGESVANDTGSRSRQTHLASQLDSGGSLTLLAANDATLTASKINAGQDIAVIAGGNIALKAVKDSSQANFNDGRSARNRQLDETVRGSELNAGGKITVVATDLNKLIDAAPTAAGNSASGASRAISLEAARLSSQRGAIAIAADDSITLKEASERHEAMSETKQGSRGLFSSQTTTTRSESRSELAIGSSLSGDSVRIDAGRDLTVKGSTVVATHDTTLTAGKQLSIEAARETHSQSHFTETKQSGLFSSGGIGITLGSRQQSTDQQSDAATAGKSTVGSLEGKVSLTAGERYRQQGSDVIAATGDIEITAKTVDIREARETRKTTIDTKSSQSGLTLALTSPVISAVQTVQQMSQAAKDSQDSRMKVLAAANVGMTANNAVDAIKAGQGTTIDGKTNQVPVINDKGEAAGTRDANAADKVGGINISLSIGASASSSKSTQSSDSAAASNLTAGRDITITASGAGKDSDITVQGSKATAARNLALVAEDEIRLLAAANTADQQSTNKNSSASVGVSFGTNGLMLNVGVSGGRGKADGKDVSYTNTRVEAGNTLTLNSGADTTLKGAVAKGEQVIASVGKDLSIESLQDTSTYDSRQQSLGASVSVGYGKMSGSLSASGSKVKSDFASVAEQSAIKAGDGGFQVDAKGNTDLKAGAITSTQAAIDADKNRFRTGGELSTSDLQNKAEYSAQSASVNIGTGFDAAGKLTPQGTSAGFGKDGGKAGSTTQAGISGVAGNRGARSGDKESGIKPIFDQQQVQKEIDAQTKITQMFGQQAPKAAAGFAETRSKALQEQARQEIDADKRTALLAEAKKWDEGGAYRVALHTAIGGLAGGASGALGAGATAAAAPLLNELQDNIAKGLKEAGANDSLAKVAGQLIAGGTAAGIGAAAGGGIGAVTGFNADANNRQLHETEKQRIRQLANGDKEKEARLTAAGCALVHCADGVPKDDANYAYLKSLQNYGNSLTDEKALLSSQTGWQGRTSGPLFQYAGVDQYFIDPLTQSKIGTRVGGALQAVGGAALIASAAPECATGAACALGAASVVFGADNLKAGASTVVTGQPTVTYGEQVLRSLGLSPEAAAITYSVVGLSPAAVEAVAVNRAVSQVAAQNAAAKLSYAPIEKFGAKGLQVTPDVMNSPQARAMVDEYLAAGVPASKAVDYTADLLKTGKALPDLLAVSANTELVKVVPKTAMAGDVVSDYTPFFMTRQQYEMISKLPPEQIAQRLGLPAEQAIRGTQFGFDVYSMKPLSGVTPKAFTSDVAPIEQGAYSANGGAQQVLIPNRTQWTDPNANKIGSIKGAL